MIDWFCEETPKNQYLVEMHEYQAADVTRMPHERTAPDRFLHSFCMRWFFLQDLEEWTNLD